MRVAALLTLAATQRLRLAGDANVARRIEQPVACPREAATAVSRFHTIRTELLEVGRLLCRRGRRHHLLWFCFPRGRQREIGGESRAGERN